MSALARVCTASTADSPTTPATSATAAAVTAVRFRFAHRRARRDIGSRQAETGSSAIHRSTSSASARPTRSGPRAACAIALRQTASSARSIDGSSCRGGGKSPRCTARSTSPSRRPRTAAGRSAGSRAWRPGCRRPTAARGGRGRPRPARGSCRPACPAPSRAASRHEPLAEDGMSVRSPRSRPGSARPMALARPQSTTSVSPCLPTMMLPGLMSRCSTPRLWA